MVVLFGSYARGDYVDRDFTIEENSLREYRSDFDIMIMVGDKKADNNAVGLEYEIEKKLKKRKIKTPMSILVEGIGHVNEQLELGRYFYKDMKREGVCIANTAKYELAKAKKISSWEKRAMAEEDYSTWTIKAHRRLEDFKTHIDKNWYSDAAFDLHQATENLFTAISLVYTTYRPKSHDLAKLYERIVKLDPRFDIFVLGTQEEKDNFELLRAAYIDARYKKGYKISNSQLGYLEKVIKTLADVTANVCTEKIAELV